MIKPPGHLSKAAAAKWSELQKEYSITDGGGLLLLTALAESWEQMTAARELIAAEGLILENPATGLKRLNPAAAALKEARASFFKAISMLNLETESELITDDFDDF